MKRRIIGYHQDERGDWVAELDCHHGQHVRHQPPFTLRPWVESQSGRNSRLGMHLNCVRCDALELPEGLKSYKQTPTFTETTIPRALQVSHSLKNGIWGMIHVLDGCLQYTLERQGFAPQIIHAGKSAVVPPEVPHHIQATGPVQCFIEFFRRQAD